MAVLASQKVTTIAPEGAASPKLALRNPDKPGEGGFFMEETLEVWKDPRTSVVGKLRLVTLPTVSWTFYMAIEPAARNLAS